MKRSFVLLLILAIGVGGFGFYRGWWSVQTSGTGGSSGTHLTVDKDKIQDDKDKLTDKARSAEHKVEWKVSR